MVVAIPALIEAVGTVSTLAKQAVSFVENIRAKDKEAKNELLQNLTELKNNLRLTGELAGLAESYFKAYENVLKLRSLCSRASTFLEENLDDCRKRTSPAYAGSWKVLRIIIQTINSDRGVTRDVVMDLTEWYDENDKGKVKIFITQFTTAYDHADIHLEAKMADDLLRDLQEMTVRLLDIEAILKDTIYDKILKNLQKLGQ
jgi:hypothetical protein